MHCIWICLLGSCSFIMGNRIIHANGLLHMKATKIWLPLRPNAYALVYRSLWISMHKSTRIAMLSTAFRGAHASAMMDKQC